MRRLVPGLDAQGARIALPLLFAVALVGLLTWRPEVGGNSLVKEWPGDGRPGIHRLDILDRSGTLLAYSFASQGGAPSRFYPYDPVMTAVVGFVDQRTGRGLSGLEFQYDSLLSSSRRGTHLRTTVDKTLQFKAFSILKTAARLLRAGTGSCLIMDADTGAILALAQTPSPSANAFWKAPESAVAGHAITGRFHPVALATASAGSPSPSSSPRWLEMNHGIRLLSSSGEGRKGEWATVPVLVRLGFGQKTGIDLPGESAGCISATSASGLDLLAKVEATPIQILKGYAMIVNGGRPVVSHPRLLPGIDLQRPAPSTTKQGGWDYHVGVVDTGSNGSELVVLAGRSGATGTMVAVLALQGVRGKAERVKSLLAPMRQGLEFALALPPMDAPRMAAQGGYGE